MSGGWLDGQSIEIRDAVKENTSKLENSTRELERFNKTSTFLACAMILIGVVQIIVALMKHN